MALATYQPFSVLQMTTSISPRQFSLFPDRCRLLKVMLEEGKRRFYAMRTFPTLFGDWALQREWGRIGSGGRVRHDLYRNEGDALPPSAGSPCDGHPR